MSEDLRMGDKRLLVRVPSERTNTEMNHSELLGKVLNFEVANIILVVIELFSPRCAGNSGHYQINSYEIARNLETKVA
ncbi:hypothetical protein KY285_030668 [Solanum tuberosum]|nr:hypothetical protein KY285_030668 [Solanum tuberosum]